MADLQEVGNVFVRVDGTLVVSIKGSEPPRYVDLQPISGTIPSPFRYGAGQFGAGSLIATIAHGLGATPSLIIMTATNGTGALAAIAADATYIRAQLASTQGAATVFTYLAGR